MDLILIEAGPTWLRDANTVDIEEDHISNVPERMGAELAAFLGP